MELGTLALRSIAPPGLALRPVQPGDAPFLRLLHDELRGAELDAWGWPDSARQGFLAMQFQAWSAAVAFSPDAVLVLEGGTAVGLLVLSERDGTRLLSEIALSAAVRGRGYGTAILRALQAAGRPIALHVLHGSPAFRLYGRLGFLPTDDDGIRIGMFWSPARGGTT